MTQPTIIGDRYEILGRLGAGGMAVVYRARDNRLAREVAIKVLRKEAVSTKDATMFHREARVIAALRHFNIIQIYDFSGPEESSSYLVMELIEGSTLEALLDKYGPLPEAVMLLIGRAIASALEHSHERGVIHRDIKPANILVENTGRVLLTDFGIAKPFRDVKALGDTVVACNTGLFGTPAFMAPEQIAEEPIGSAVDVFSLGSLLHYMLTGSSPFCSDDDVVETLRRILDVEYTAAKLKRPELSDDLTHLIDPCLRRDPAARPSAAEVSSRCSRLVRRLDLGDSQRTLARFLATGVVPVADVTEIATGTFAALRKTPAPAAPQSKIASTTQPLAVPIHRPAPSTKRRHWILLALAVLLLAGLGLTLALLRSTTPAPMIGRPAESIPPLPWPGPTEPTTGTVTVSPPPTSPQPVVTPAVEPPSQAHDSATAPVVGNAPQHLLPASADTSPAARPGKRKRATRGEEKATPAQDAQVEVNVRPWGQITIDGVPIGNTPLVRVVPLSPGKHTITIHHPSLGTQQQTFVLRSGERRVLSFDLQGEEAVF